MTQIIVTSKDELEDLIHKSVRRILSENGKQTTQTEQDKILTIQQASKYLNLAPQTLYGFTSKNEIPFIKKGKKLYFLRSELENWLMEGNRKSRSQIEREMQKEGGSL
jgi:excisionase family DNA binding protein